MESEEMRLLTPIEVSKRTGIPVPTIYRMVAKKTMPSLRAGTAIRIPLTALREWIAANTVPAVASVQQTAEAA